MKQMAIILPGLKLDRIHLKADRNAYADWEDFPQAFRTVLLACISTSHMKELCRDDIWHIPLSSFADCEGLKRLKR